METPLDLFCLRSGTFCPQCEAKIRSGKVSQLDVDVTRLLLDLEPQFPALQDATYIKAAETEDFLAVVLKEGDLSRMSVNVLTKLARGLSAAIGKKVKFLEDSSDPTKFLESLVAPARIIAVNQVWLPDGSVATRIILDDKRSLRMSENSIIELGSKIKNMSLRIDFERKRFSAPSGGRGREAAVRRFSRRSIDRRRRG
ncbi:MAG: hypothetical protein ACETV0_01365 [Nitrososphaeria archaeon]